MGSRIDIMVQFIHLRITIWFLRAAGDDLKLNIFLLWKTPVPVAFPQNIFSLLGTFLLQPSLLLSLSMSLIILQRPINFKLVLFF